MMYTRVNLSPFSIAIASLGEEVLVLVLFVRLFVLVWICRFPLPLGDWEGLRFVIGLWHSLDFSLTFFCYKKVGFKGVKII